MLASVSCIYKTFCFCRESTVHSGPSPGPDLSLGWCWSLCRHGVVWSPTRYTVTLPRMVHQHDAHVPDPDSDLDTDLH